MDLPARIDDRPMPQVRVLDLRSETLVGTGQTFSQRLLDGIADRLRAGEQVMLFLNRRGFSTFVMCRDCGYVLRCPDCDISLTFHYQGHSCTCHHCDYARHVPEKCPNCDKPDIGFHGLGTEKVSDQVVRTFPEAKVARMDRDTIAHKGAYGRILGDFAAGKANVLVGTQMIAKGHDFPGVTLVGVLNADTGLHRPDFRAAEHTFAVLTQVAGRAGRADKPGEVLVQTYNPDHYAIITASRHDYQGFYQRELAGREKNAYPPFVRLARLVFAAENEELCHAEAGKVAAVLRKMGIPEKHGPRCFLGPAVAPLHKLRGRYRYSILLKSADDGLSDLVRELLARATVHKDVGVTVDVDPTDMM
jgi:primosomal protein N' (replication factor Y)